MSLKGVKDILSSHCTPSIDVANSHTELESEQNTPQDWEDIPISEENIEDSIKKLSDVIFDVSTEVSRGTDASYRSYGRHFDIWCQENDYIPEQASVFQEPFLDLTPMLIIAWIMFHCDVIRPDGTKRPLADIPCSYSHAEKLRASATYNFGRHYHRGNIRWNFNSFTSSWEGNPSICTEVDRYMLSLRRRKMEAGDTTPMSSLAITSDVLRALHAFNNEEDRTNVDIPFKKVPKMPLNPRRRLLVYAVATLAFTCLLRLDEALKLRFEDVEVLAPNRLKITLRSRKTQQFGGVKPFYLWTFPAKDRHLCAVTALAKWVKASGLRSGFIFRSPLSTGKAPDPENNTPVSSSTFIEWFRNNLVDIGIRGTFYAGHSFRRGGCQWLLHERRWPIVRVCDWGGWSKDFNHSSIIRYIFALDDHPYESREEYFSPCFQPMTKCYTCGRGCGCRGQ